MNKFERQSRHPADQQVLPEAVAGELSAGKKLDHATRVGIGTWIGLLFGTLAKLALCFTMLGVFALAFLIA